jgi:hypothetical protein
MPSFTTFLYSHFALVTLASLLLISCSLLYADSLLAFPPILGGLLLDNGLDCYLYISVPCLYLKHAFFDHLS